MASMVEKFIELFLLAIVALALLPQVNTAATDAAAQVSSSLLSALLGLVPTFYVLAIIIAIVAYLRFSPK